MVKGVTGLQVQFHKDGKVVVMEFKQDKVNDKDLVKCFNHSLSLLNKQKDAE